MLATISKTLSRLGGSVSPRGGMRAFGYDAVEENGRRKPSSGILRDEEKELPDGKRRKLTAASHDMRRNFALIAWALRKHLDYVADHSFQARTPDQGLNRELEAFVAEASQPANCDAAKRHSLKKLIRLAEAMRCTAGDMLFLKLATGQIQGIEGDRLRTPTVGLEGLDINAVRQGIHVDPAGAALRFAVHRRNNTMLEFERWVPAANCMHFGYFDRFDQVRGVSPLAAGLATMQDAYEGCGYALAKMKVAQLFTMAIMRNSLNGGPLPTQNGSEDDDGDESGTDYEIDFGKGPTLLQLDPGDKAEVLTENQPSDQFQSFMQQMIALTLKSLDIPYSFYAENFTNYSGSRQALLQYEQSAEAKREDVVLLLDHWTQWRFNLAIQDEQLKFDPAILKWEWVAAGIPWIDPLKEVQADVAAVNNVMNSRQRLLRARGLDFFTVVDELAAENEYMVTKHVSPVSLPGAAPAEADKKEPPADDAAAAEELAAYAAGEVKLLI